MNQSGRRHRSCDSPAIQFGKDVAYSGNSVACGKVFQQRLSTGFVLAAGPLFFNESRKDAAQSMLRTAPRRNCKICGGASHYRRAQQGGPLRAKLQALHDYGSLIY
jgi:hypothetical protein